MDRSLRACLLVLTAVACGWVLWLGSFLLIPLLLAIFVWHLVDAMARGLQKLLPGVVSGALSTDDGAPLAIVHFLLLALLFVVFYSAAGAFIDVVELVRARIPIYADNIKVLFNSAIIAGGMEDKLPEVDKITGNINFAAITGILFATATSVTGSSVAVLLYVVFLILEQHGFSRKLGTVCGSEARTRMVDSLLQQIGGSIRTYVWLKSVIAAGTGFVSYLVLLLAGVDFAAFWGVVIFALSYVPYLGALLSVILPALMALAQFGQWQQMIQVVIALTVAQVIMGHILEPRLFGRNLNVSPLVVLFSLAFWGALWGGVGMFLSVPITVVAMIVCAHIPALRPVAVILSADGNIPASPGAGQGTGHSTASQAS